MRLQRRLGPLLAVTLACSPALGAEVRISPEAAKAVVSRELASLLESRASLRDASIATEYTTSGSGPMALGSSLYSDGTWNVTLTPRTGAALSLDLDDVGRVVSIVYGTSDVQFPAVGEEPIVITLGNVPTWADSQDAYATFLTRVLVEDAVIAPDNRESNEEVPAVNVVDEGLPLKSGGAMVILSADGYVVIVSYSATAEFQSVTVYERLAEDSPLNPSSEGFNEDITIMQQANRRKIACDNLLEICLGGGDADTAARACAGWLKYCPNM